MKRRDERETRQAVSAVRRLESVVDWYQMIVLI